MSKKLPIYFSDDAWSSLQELMGPEGKPSPTINTVLEQIAVQNELVEKLGLTAVLPKSKVSIPVSLERIPAGPAFSTKDEQDKALDLNEFLIHNPISTFIAYVDSESMLDAGLELLDPPAWQLAPLVKVYEPTALGRILWLVVTQVDQMFPDFDGPLVFNRLVPLNPGVVAH